MDINEVLKQFSKWQLTGSTVIDPDGVHNDTDYICLYTPDKGMPPLDLDEFEQMNTTSEKYIGTVYRAPIDCDNIDLTVTEDEAHYDKIVLATEVCTSLRLSDRDDRIMVFHAIAYSTRSGSLNPVISIPIDEFDPDFA